MPQNFNNALPRLKIESLHTFPIKGCQSHDHESVNLVENHSIPLDRAFSFLYLSPDLDPNILAQSESDWDQPNWIAKKFLVNQRDWPEMAQLKPRFDSSNQVLSLEHNGEIVSAQVRNPEDRKRLCEFVFTFLKKSKPYENSRNPNALPLRLLGTGALQARYTDSSDPPLSIGFLESLQEIEKKIGKNIERNRFRNNIWLSGARPWFENEFKEPLRLKINEAEIELIKPIGRCPNIDVHPMTGIRDLTLYPQMKDWFGHSILGVKCRVIRGGSVQVGASAIF
jgi:uncharacterized protein YcbX